MMYDFLKTESNFKFIEGFQLIAKN